MLVPTISAKAATSRVTRAEAAAFIAALVLNIALRCFVSLRLVAKQSGRQTDIPFGFARSRLVLLRLITVIKVLLGLLLRLKLGLVEDLLAAGDQVLRWSGRNI